MDVFVDAKMDLKSLPTRLHNGNTICWNLKELLEHMLHREEHRVAHCKIHLEHTAKYAHFKIHTLHTTTPHIARSQLHSRH